VVATELKIRKNNGWEKGDKLREKGGKEEMKSLGEKGLTLFLFTFLKHK